ncbi:hypothetical protein [Desulfonatronovibrio hydrogenovorans]|uniref:hypothetical protein n=1 Tax=Desulfonatronovibrio hydrogenovorans TaxID=53245 RepID=UPI00129477F3|nr:hypothetical protein [Desulfonatronovibrio hydrogenovorans]
MSRIDLNTVNLKARRRARRNSFINDPARFHTRKMENKKRKQELKPGWKERQNWLQ